jgi:hypothetical protein
MTGCPACIPQKAPAHSESLALDPVSRLVDEAHYIVTICACPRCGQEFLRIFTERIDWGGGEDPQRVTVLPITHEEARALISAGEHLHEADLSRMGLERRFLEFDWPSGESMRSRYTTGYLVAHHD